MKILWNIFKYIASVVIALLVVLYVIAILFEKDISRIFIGELNKKLTTNVHTEELDFSLIKRFPRASISLEDIFIHSPQQENDTLLYADRLILELKITELIKGNYVIDRVDIRNGKINITRDADGKTNTEIWEKPDKADSLSLSLDINNISVYNSFFSFRDFRTGIYSAGKINRSANTIRIRQEGAYIKSGSEFETHSIKISESYRLEKNVPFDGDLEIIVKHDSILIEPSHMTINAVEVAGLGYFSKQDVGFSFETAGTAAENIIEVLPAGLRNSAGKYDVSGSVSSIIELSGTPGTSTGYNVIAALNTTGASFRIPSQDILINDINSGFEIRAETGNLKKSFSLAADDYSAMVSGSVIRGSFMTRDLDNPYIDIILRATLSPEMISGLTDSDKYSLTAGTVRLNARLKGLLPAGGEKGFIDRLAPLEKSVNLGLKSVSLKTPVSEYPFSSINGNIMIAENIWFDDLSLVYMNNNFALNGMIKGSRGWLTDRSLPFYLTAGIWSDMLNINELRKSINLQPKSDRNTNFGLNLDLRCDSLISGNLGASLFDGNLGYRPGLVDISSFSMNCLGGSLEGNAVIANLKNSGYRLRAWFDIEDIDIHSTFSTFNNFRQDHIKAENLYGTITGNISISAQSDPDFRISTDNLVVNGDYYILDGRLVDFEPAYRLSRFVDISELENIEFSRLENDLVINNRMVTIPLMNINSSAFNIELRGEHSFEGSYKYHLRVRLSELLSRRENKKVSEFGEIEDDGLGRTSLYLKLEGDKQGSKVSHDINALGQKIRTDLDEEKVTIRNILNEEYGWYETDTAIKKDAGEARRFRIEWEETDSIQARPEEKTKKELPLFKFLRNKITKKDSTGKGKL